MQERVGPGEFSFFALPFQSHQVQEIGFPVPGPEPGIGIVPGLSDDQVIGMEIFRITTGRPLVQHQRRLEPLTSQSRSCSSGRCSNACLAEHHGKPAQFPLPELEAADRLLLHLCQGCQQG